MKRILVLLLLATCAGCEPNRDLGPKDTSRFPVARNYADCEAAGGTWLGIEPDDPHGVCSIPTPDAGKECTDSDDCAAFCVVKVHPEPMAIGDRVIGQCLDTFRVQGCHDLVEDGRYHGQLCID